MQVKTLIILERSLTPNTDRKVNMNIDDLGHILVEADNREEKLRELLSRCLSVIPDGEEILIAEVRKELFCE